MANTKFKVGDRIRVNAYDLNDHGKYGTVTGVLGLDDDVLSLKMDDGKSQCLFDIDVDRVHESNAG